MTTIDVRLATEDRTHEIVFDAIADLGRHLEKAGLSAGRAIVVSDSTVEPLFGGVLEKTLTRAGWTVRTLIVPAGEQSKSLDTYSSLIDNALAEPLTRQTVVFALGGGVVGDLAGFLASTLLRGIPLVQIPTTLVAQVDSAIGGKTGINHHTGKNLVGAFYQPQLVFVDLGFLKTLQPEIWLDGLSEVVKYALIADESLFESLRQDWDSLVARERSVVAPIVHRCAEIKAGIVSEDEKEGGRRAILNFGHTFGHALERLSKYAEVSHGQAVAVGMRAALHLSSLLFDDFDAGPALDLVGKLRVPAISADRSVDALIKAMQSDKKRTEGGLRFVTIDAVGSARVVEDLEIGLVEASWRFALDGR